MRSLLRSLGSIVVVTAMAGGAWAAPAKGKGKAATAAATPKAAPKAPAKIDVEATRKALLGEDLASALDAATKLGDSRQPGTVDALLDGLAMGLAPEVAVAALDALGAHGDAKALDVLLAYARSRNVDVRAAAIGALGSLDDAKARAAVLAALGDGEKEVRTAAAKVVEDHKLKDAVPELLALLQLKDDSGVAALAAVADAQVAAQVAELVGDPKLDSLIAQCLGLMLLRKDLGPETVYVDVVHAIAKIPTDDAVTALSNYVSTPDTTKTPRASKREAQAVIDQRVNGGQP